MTVTQYKIYVQLFNGCNDEFWQLPAATLKEFFDVMYAPTELRASMFVKPELIDYQIYESAHLNHLA